MERNRGTQRGDTGKMDKPASSSSQDVGKDTNDAANIDGLATRFKMAISSYHLLTIITMAAVALVAAGAVITMAGVVMYLTVTPNRQADINVVQAASHNVVTATLPQMTTTLSWMTTTLPQMTTTLQQVTTTLPQVTTTLPWMTTTLQQVTTTLPWVTTSSQCSKLTPPTNGAVTGSNSYRDVTIFTCNPGYKLVGTSTRTCQSDGTWSGGSPACKIVQCPTLKPSVNVIMEGTKSYRGVTYFSCTRGHSVVGAKSIKCRADAVQCTRLTPPRNGAVSVYNSYGDVATFTCNPGYKLVGTSTRTCQSDGTWSGGSSTCRGSQCTGTR
ncbi:sushi, von Willebrand factor type A, EGF and pentraxin domain-containing protein 1-like [Branchiostoma floridae]|uniref:Sushi, von Willebrand factor type A, EGF and pentraxin domain-containing protein 1-like n=1 Tax=Branchiostoma floridae TaxID=7739 RepID=A0A9J7HMA3_BRAFL|nr:sushi, von Willebrand factor type A, EGF and pentraxin domain-containing protein 1-like [Branchiostoma floridae]